MSSERKTRAKRQKLEDCYVETYNDESDPELSQANYTEDQDEVRKSKIRESNKEFAKRMTILQTWACFWSDYSVRAGEAYPQQQAKEIIKEKKKITCPISSCDKSFTTIGGLKYHYARCNILKSFSCKKCDPNFQFQTRGELLRHLILTHLEELPELSSEQKEIVRTYIKSENKGEKKRSDRRSNAPTDFEPNLTGSRVVKAYQELLESVYCEVERPYNNWNMSMGDWNELKLPQKEQYYPPETNSVRFKNESSDSWITLPVGKAEVLKYNETGDPASICFFTGGINTSLAWLPKPNKSSQKQLEFSEVLAVCVDACSMNTTHTFKVEKLSKGLIQFWTFDNAKNPKPDDLQTTATGIHNLKLTFTIGHEYGRIYDSSWCPLGVSWKYDDVSSSGKGLDAYTSRMGLLALGCEDGFIRIISVPHLQTLPLNQTDLFFNKPMFTAKPVIVLCPPGVGPSTDYQQTICKSICWDIQGSQRYIAAGYGNGTVALFDLSNNSLMLTKTNNQGSVTLLPIQMWSAHGAAVTGIAISGNAHRLYIATASIDRQVKIWNTKDLHCQIFMDRAPLTKILWDFRSRGVISASDCATTSFINRVSYRYPTSEGTYGMTVSMHRSTVWGLANSIITNSVATSDAAGEVFVAPNILRLTSRKEKGYLNAHSLYSIVPVPLNDEKFEVTMPRVTINEDGDCEIEESPRESPNHSLINSEHWSDDGGLVNLEGDFNVSGRDIVNKPSKFLLPMEHRPVVSHKELQKNYGINYLSYSNAKHLQKQSESCQRASDLKQLNCDRICDYPFSSINCVCWSPNIETFSFLLSAGQIGLCRIDNVDVVEKSFKSMVSSTFAEYLSSKRTWDN